MNSTSNRPEASAPARGPGAKRALVIRIGALGDVLLTRRLTYSLRLSGFHSTLFAPARHATLLLADPWIDGVLDSEGPAHAAALSGSWPESAGRFEVAIVISNSNDLIEAAKGAAGTLIRIPPAPVREDALISTQWSEAAAALAAPFAGLLPRLMTRAQEATFAGATLIHPGSGSARKNWPIERFVDLSRKIESLGHRVVWIRGPAEMGQPEVWTGERIDRPSLQGLAATLAASRLFIGNDSGVSHLAGAVGAATVALFGPTRGDVWRPDGPRVRVVDSPNGTMAGLALEAVLAEAKASLHEGQEGGSK